MDFNKVPIQLKFTNTVLENHLQKVLNVASEASYVYRLLIPVTDFSLLLDD